MNLQSDRISPATTDEDEASGEEGETNDRRRRFCIERRQDLETKEPSTKRSKTETIDRNKLENYHRNTGRRRPRVFVNREVNHFPSARERMKLEHPKGPVIFINPNFIKKFVEKSIELSSSKLQSCSSPSSKSSHGQPATTSASKLNENIDFRTCPRESLQAAAAMAIIRLVTECIENARKRDERLNKVLVKRLIDALDRHGNQETKMSSTPCQSNQQNATEATSSSNYSEQPEISDDGLTESSSGGQPIPVIGGSISHHFEKPIEKDEFYAQNSQRYGQFSRSKQAGERARSQKSSDVNKNKLKYFS